MKIEQKLKAQVKTKFYYLFWGTATLSVFAGQIYVGSGDRQMASSLDNWLDKSISVLLRRKMESFKDRDRGYYMPMPSPMPDYRIPQDGVIR